LALSDQITLSFVRAAGVLAKGLMFDMPDVDHHQVLRARSYSKVCLKVCLLGPDDGLGRPKHVVLTNFTEDTP